MKNIKLQSMFSDTMFLRMTAVLEDVDCRRMFFIRIIFLIKVQILLPAPIKTKYSSFPNEEWLKTVIYSQY